MEPVNEPFGNTANLDSQQIEDIWHKADCSRGDEAHLRNDIFDVINSHNELLEELNRIQSIQQEREPVRWFAGLMESRLLENDYKGGWGPENCSMDFLSEQMDRKCRRYVGLNGSGDTPEGFINTLADIANYAMMLADRMRRVGEERT
ncbi:hypothetical protein [Paenibacillus ginsengarvi]|uniref:Nucleotide modification associated domain-containing protein n=1 Tax=Paenibacillus ginsengarvi TaxID=400777 RepID=A0A3B0CVE0_9BACL|nr:hypothetical protein [Paenibacillus ginsengarvi]RKN86767.1 hypothetical protein D7M11_02070 [Paenibacillus ginsengarvi]